jgi:hypothetical protein
VAGSQRVTLGRYRRYRLEAIEEWIERLERDGDVAEHALSRR